MFQVGIEEVERKLSSVRAEYDSFAEKYKDGITIKLKLDEAESLASSLSKIGDPKALMPYLDEIERLKKLLGDAKNAIDFLLSLFYIKPQLRPDPCRPSSDCLLSLFYIKPQLMKSSATSFWYCLLSLFYIKPQRKWAMRRGVVNCLLSLFYIKPQLADDMMRPLRDCLLSLFYNKPQLQ